LESLPDAYEISVDDVERAVKDVEIQRGDVVLIRTGKIKEFYADPAAFVRGQPGIGVAAAVWLYERGMSVLGMDTPPEPAPRASGPLTHIALIVERGVHIIENLNLEELGENHVTEALFVCLPLKLSGASGSFVRPVAIV
jgi:kynurenine formamidase